MKLKRQKIKHTKGNKSPFLFVSVFFVLLVVVFATGKGQKINSFYQQVASEPAFGSIGDCSINGTCSSNKTPTPSRCLKESTNAKGAKIIKECATSLTSNYSAYRHRHGRHGRHGGHDGEDTSGLLQLLLQLLQLIFQQLSGGTPPPPPSDPGGNPAPSSDPGGNPAPSSDPGGNPAPSSDPGGNPAPTGATPVQHVDLDPSMCVASGSSGNSNGVGASCTAMGTECMARQSAPNCYVGSQGTGYCSADCTSDAQCGEGAVCLNLGKDPSGQTFMQCTPNTCLKQ